MCATFGAMLPLRVVGVSPDKKVRRIISTGLMSAGAVVEQHESLGDMKPGPINESILVLHIEDSVGTALLGSICDRLKPAARLIAVVPKSDIETTVAAMQASEQISCVLVAEGLSSTRVAKAASKLLYGDIFGLEKMVPWGTRVFSTLVGSYQDKSMCISDMNDFAGAMGVRRKYREAIEQCADEMLMNALYDAPVDANGKPLFADVPIKERIKVQVEQKAIVQYACTDETFMFSVRDPYGTLARATVLKYLDKCLHAEEQIDRKTGGAGLGLYLMASQTTELVFNVLPNVATECICTFDLRAPKVQLTNLSMFFERIDARGRLTPGRPTLLPGGVGFPVERRTPASASNRAVLWGLSAAIALLMALIALVAYPRFTSNVGAVQVVTNPPGAHISLDGRERGTTANGPLLIDDLDLGSSYQISATLDGWSEAKSFVKPVKGETAEIVLDLQASGSVVVATSDPDGAEVWVDDESLGTTPIRLEQFEAKSQIEVEFRKSGYTPRRRTLTIPAAGRVSEVSVALALSPEFGSVSITSDPPGAGILQNGELLAGLQTPVDEHLVRASTNQVFTLRLEGYQPAHIPVRLGRGQQGHEVTAVLQPGGGISVSANVEGKVTIRDAKDCQNQPLPMLDCALPNGAYTGRLESKSMNLRHTFSFEIEDNLLEQDIRFGIIESARRQRIVLPSGRKVRRVAVPPGSHKVSIFDKDSEELAETTVEVEADRKVRVP